jgi:uncharacterized membrane protein
MFCHHCGTQVTGDAGFCPNCGQPVGAAGALGATPGVPWTPPAGIQARTGRWIGAAWAIVKADIWTYVLLALVSSIVSGAVPLILQGPMIAGFHIYTMKKLMNRPAEFGDLFTGFNFFVPTLVATILIGVFCFLGTLACIIPGLVIAAMYKFTYLFIVDKRMDFWPAMQASHAVVKQDYFGFTMFLLALVGINILGILCCIVGVLVSIPITYVAVTFAYHEIVGFDPQTAAAL